MFARRPSYFRADPDGRPTGRRVEATVKWFDAAKGFGFIACDDGGADAFLPMAVLRRAGLAEVRGGARVTCEVGSGAKGLLVVSIAHVDNRATAAPARKAVQAHGKVKWFEPAKGFGFIAPDDGGKDIFVHATVLQRSGIERLGSGQRVQVGVVEGRRGPEADSVALL